MELDAVPSVARDQPQNELTLQRARSELERASRLALAGELVIAVTHDLRQPLTALEMNVSAAMQFLRRADPSIPEALEALDDALGQQRRMRDALQVLQDLAVRREPLRAPCDVGAAVRDAVTLVSDDAFNRHVPVELHIAANVPLASVDPTLLRQALVNMLLDALEATSLSANKHAPVHVAVDGDADAAVVTVTHLGQRAEAVAPDDWTLALARAVAEAHRATLVVEGTPDAGIRVVSRWPAHA